VLPSCQAAASAPETYSTGLVDSERSAALDDIGGVRALHAGRDIDREIVEQRGGGLDGDEVLNVERAAHHPERAVAQRIHVTDADGARHQIGISGQKEIVAVEHQRAVAVLPDAADAAKVVVDDDGLAVVGEIADAATRVVRKVEADIARTADDELRESALNRQVSGLMPPPGTAMFRLPTGPKTAV